MANHCGMNAAGHNVDFTYSVKTEAIHQKWERRRTQTGYPHPWYCNCAGCCSESNRLQCSSHTHKRDGCGKNVENMPPPLHTPGSHGMHCDAGSTTKLQRDRKTTLGREEQREPSEAMHARIRTGELVGDWDATAPSAQHHQAPSTITSSGAIPGPPWPSSIDSFVVKHKQARTDTVRHREAEELRG